MQLTTYQEISAQLKSALNIPQILGLVDKILTQSTNESMEKYRQELPAVTYAARDNLYHLRKDPEIASITKAVDLDEVFSSSALTRLILALHANGSTHEVRSNVTSIHALFAFYWPLKAFMHQHEALESLVIAGRKTANKEEVLEFDVLELGQTGFDPDRVATIIPAVEKLFKGVALSLQGELPAVRIVYLDSGSPLLLAFKAAPALVNEVRLLLSELLVTVRDWRADQKSKQIKTAMEGLDFCKKLHKAEADGVVTHEQAAHAKHVTMTAAIQLVRLGVVPRGEKVIILDPKLLVEHAAQRAALPAPPASPGNQ